LHWDILFRKLPFIGSDGKWRKFFPRLRIVLFIITVFIIYTSYLGLTDDRISNFILKEFQTQLHKNYGIEINFKQSTFVIPDGFILKEFTMRTEDSVNLITCDECNVILSTKNLLSGFRIDKILLTNAVIYITHRPDGTLNWDFTKDEDDVETEEDRKKELKFPDFFIRELEIIESEVIIDDYRISNINSDISMISAAGKVNIEVFELNYFLNEQNLTLKSSGNILFRNDMTGEASLIISSLKSKIVTDIQYDLTSSDYNFNIENMNLETSDILHNSSGNLYLNGFVHLNLKNGFNYYSDLNISGFNLKYSDFYIDSLRSHFTCIDKILTADLTHISCGTGNVSGHLEYSPDIDSFFYSIDIEKLDPNICYRQLNTEITSTSGQLTGYIQSVSEISKITAYSDFSLNFTSYNTDNKIYGKLNYTRIDDSLDYFVNIENLYINIFIDDFKNNNVQGNIRGYATGFFDDLIIDNNFHLSLIQNTDLNSSFSGNINYNQSADSITFNSKLINMDPGFITSDLENYHLLFNGKINGWISSLDNNNFLRMYLSCDFDNSEIFRNSFRSISGSLMLSGRNIKINVSASSNTIGSINTDVSLNGNNIIFAKGNLENFNFDWITEYGFFEHDISGYATGNFSLINDSLDLDVIFDNIAYDDYNAERISLKTENISLSRLTGDTIELDVFNLSKGNFIINSIDLNGYSSDNFWQVSLNLNNNDNKIFSSMNFFPGSLQLVINSIAWDGNFGKISNPSPINISFKNGLLVDTLILDDSAGMEIAAYLSLIDDSLEAFIEIDSFDLAIFEASFFQNQKIEGILSMRTDISGSISKPDAKISMNTGYCYIEPFYVDSINLNADLCKEWININNFEIGTNGKISDITGIIPFNSEDSINLDLNFNDIGLWPLIFLSDIVSPIKGTLDGKMYVGGNFNDIRISGNAELSDASIYVIILGQIVNDISGSLYFFEDSLSINLSGVNSGGKIDFSGYMLFFKGFTEFQSHFKALFNNITMSGIDGVLANVTGNIEIDIDTLQVVDITGDVKINQAHLSVPSETQQSQTETTLPNMDIRIDGSEGEIWFTSDFAMANLKGDLHISSFNNLLETKGQLRVIRGNIYYLDRTFRITEGTLFVLSSGNKINGIIEIKGQTTIRYTIPTEEGTPERNTAIIHIEIKGEIDAPEFILSSDPKMSQQDIASLLTFNTTFSNISSVSTVASAVPDRAINYLLRTQIFSKLERSIGLDIIDIETEFGPTNSAKLTLGKYLTNNFYVEYRKDLLNNTNSEISLQYNIWKNTSFVLDREEENLIGLGFKLIWRY